MGSNISAVAAQPSRPTRGTGPADRDAGEAPADDTGLRTGPGDASGRRSFGTLLKDAVGKPAGRSDQRSITAPTVADAEKADAARLPALQAADPASPAGTVLLPVPVLLPAMVPAAAPAAVAANPQATIDATPAAAASAAAGARPGLPTPVPTDAPAAGSPGGPAAAAAGPTDGAPPSQAASLPPGALVDGAADRGPASTRPAAPLAARAPAPAQAAAAEPPRAAAPQPGAVPDGALQSVAAAPPRDLGGVPRGQIRIAAASPAAAAAPITGIRPAMSDDLPLAEDPVADAPTGASSAAPDVPVQGAGASLLRPVTEAAAIVGQAWQPENPTVADAPAPAAHASAPQSSELPPVDAPAPIHAAAATAPASGPTPPPAPPAQQIMPAVVALAHGRAAGRSVSVSIAPDELGQVSITVQRRANGTTDIQVAAERLTTLDLLKRDQGELVKALDQAGIGQDRSSLSFSWNGGAGGQSGLSWGQQDGQGGASRPPAVPYGDEFVPAASQAAALHAASQGAAGRGGIDVTA